MYVKTVTIAATGVAQRLIVRGPVIDDSNTAFQNVIMQNVGSNNMYIGDSAVSTTNGILLTPTGSLTAVLSISETCDLKEFWVIGTISDKLTLMIFP